MSDTVKLVIELPETTYQEVIESRDTSNTSIYNAIRNCKPLSEVLAEIKGEIEELQKACHEFGWIYEDAIEIIDKHISGEEDK